MAQQQAHHHQGVDDSVMAVLLAAGASSRYGGDKLLAGLTINGITAPLIGHTLTNWLTVFENVIVVVRPGHLHLQKYIEERHDTGQIQLVVAKDAYLGMGHSIVAGVKSSTGTKGWVVGLADMPFIPSDVIASVRSAILVGAGIALPVRDQRRGHPVGFSKTYEQHLLGLEGDMGAKAIIAENFSDIKQIPTKTDSIFYDIDEPGDLVNAPQFIAAY
jgi:molybdenum cofactor cytidylyltransferase